MAVGRGVSGYERQLDSQTPQMTPVRSERSCVDSGVLWLDTLAYLAGVLPVVFGVWRLEAVLPLNLDDGLRSKT